jgi:hypothetical protein
MWVLRAPGPDPRGRPSYLATIVDGRVATSLEMATARRFGTPEDLIDFVQAHPAVEAWVPVRIT